jgi:DNA polymerase-3 subunit delta
MSTGAPSVVLIRGDDPSLVAQGARSAIDEAVGGGDGSLMVEEYNAASEEFAISHVIDALVTPPFLIPRRVVVVREVGKLIAADANQLGQALQSPLPEVFCVLVGGGGTITPSLVKAVQGAGAVIETKVGTGKDRTRWLHDQLSDAPLRLDAQAQRRVEEHLGDDLGRLEGLLSALVGAYGKGVTLSAQQVEPFLGEAGSVPPWELTDAIDSGNVAEALHALQRMMGPGGRPAPLIIGALHSHYAQMLRLDGEVLSAGEDAAALIGSRSAFVGKKALAGAKRLGTQRIAQAILLIAKADVDVKGATALEPAYVLEVLVARLSRLGGVRAGASR